MKNLNIPQVLKDDFDSVKHVTSNLNGEIFSIERLENGLYQLQSIDNPKNIVVLTYEDLQENYRPIELLEHWLHKKPSEIKGTTNQNIDRIFYDGPRPDGIQ